MDSFPMFGFLIGGTVTFRDLEDGSGFKFVGNGDILVPAAWTTLLIKLDSNTYMRVSSGAKFKVLDPLCSVKQVALTQESRSMP